MRGRAGHWKVEGEQKELGSKGDSTTVQGAVDMVPQNNTERVKIYIYPGIYRFAITINLIFIVIFII